MRNTHLFLFGGSPPFSKKLGKKFTDLSLNKKGKVAILFIKRDGWEEYMQKYTCVLESYGLEDFVYLALSSNPNLLLKELNSCTGIIISGGETELYHNYIVNTSIGKNVKKMYEQGMPVAGFSAGALISPEICVIPPIDNLKNEHLFLNGLGLIKDCVISVHYSKWNEEENLKTAISKENVPIGYGIDDDEVYILKMEFLLKQKVRNSTFSRIAMEKTNEFR
ncbi:Type 1 glutamine amidotransferase-like domain-containing protein [Virgibacillus sp. C22-A2]|uniref:Type 1 glutamine amidotransferase-like domain-containing protein n=1 Tax=Virgibacillus tibetensis TaxID=3042313 RepID=A0ABU6KHD9_9BACI|nr:Type 1 glutamine amidotransferase-like domain-containing protein [Virgibacillus sp. C22-A2]